MAAQSTCRIETARLRPDGQIGRMAALTSQRGRGVGRRPLPALPEQARPRERRRVRVQARAAAEGFYAAHGDRPAGSMFTGAGVPHRRMTRAPADPAAPAAGAGAQ